MIPTQNLYVNVNNGISTYPTNILPLVAAYPFSTQFDAKQIPARNHIDRIKTKVNEYLLTDFILLPIIEKLKPKGRKGKATRTSASTNGNYEIRFKTLTDLEMFINNLK